MRECRYNGNCCVEFHRPFDSDEIPCDGYDGETCSMYKPMPDVNALKGLADEMEGFGDEIGRAIRMTGAFVDSWESCAHRIREALGVEDGAF